MARSEIANPFQKSINSYKVKSIPPSAKFWLRRNILTYWYQFLSYSAYGLSFILPTKLLRLERPIFILGCSRSGTTLFVNLFSRHKDLANWSEAVQVYELDIFNPEIEHPKSADDVTSFHTRRLQTLLGLYVKILGKSRFVNKHPENSLRIGFLKSIFPGALFIHVIRDGRAVVRSNYSLAVNEMYRRRYPFGFFPKPAKWRSYLSLPLECQFAHQWSDVVSTVRDDATAYLSPDSYVEIRYEEFCRNPHGVLARLDEFCSLQADRRLYTDIPAALNLQNFKWQNDFDESQISRIEEIIGPLNALLSSQPPHSSQ